MSYKNSEVIEQQEVHEKSWFERFRNKFAVAGAGVTTAVAVGSAHAEAANVSGLYTQATTDLGGVSAGTLSVILLLAGVVALLIGWSYFKKTR